SRLNGCLLLSRQYSILCLKLSIVIISDACSTGKKPTSKLSEEVVNSPPIGFAKKRVLQIDFFTFWKTPQNLRTSISIPDSSLVSLIAASFYDSPSSTIPPGIFQPLIGPLISKISFWSLSTIAAAETKCFEGV